jgi:hypothetical protein
MRSIWSGRITRARVREHVSVLEMSEVEAWVRARVDLVEPLQIVDEHAWGTVVRVPLADGPAWFKACGSIQTFEPRLTAELFERWPDRVAQVLAFDESRGWLLLADAGAPVGELGNPPQAWLAALPRYAELQRGETDRAPEHIAHGVPDMRLTRLPELYEDLLRLDLPLDQSEIDRLRGFAPRLMELCDELAGCGVAETIQHDDLHHANLFVRDSQFRVLDWGDASVGHPFVTLVVTFRFLRERTGLAANDAWFARLRHAYLEPWGRGLDDTLERALRVGAFARAIAYLRQRAVLASDEVAEFDVDFAAVLRSAVARTIS